MKRYQHFGKAIQSTRKARNLSQSQMADVMKLHPQFISNSERGTCALPKPAMKRFVKKLNVSQEEKVQLFNALIQDRIDELNLEYKGILL